MLGLAAAAAVPLLCAIRGSRWTCMLVAAPACEVDGVFGPASLPLPQTWGLLVCAGPGATWRSAAELDSTLCKSPAVAGTGLGLKTCGFCTDAGWLLLLKIAVPAGLASSHVVVTCPGWGGPGVGTGLPITCCSLRISGAASTLLVPASGALVGSAKVGGSARQWGR